jgi:antagonist of KipI
VCISKRLARQGRDAQLHSRFSYSDSAMPKTITVIQPGLLTTLQDLGRWGFQAIGMPVAGVMDEYAARVGNLLVGNPEHAPVLEITLLGPELRFAQETSIAITGGDLQPRVNAHPLAGWATYRVQPEDILRFDGVCRGCRAYLAVSGGFQADLVMGSAATYLRGQIGGYQGRTLRAGDVLRIGICTDLPDFKNLRDPVGQLLTLPPEYLPEARDTVRVILGPQAEAFTEDGLNTFLTAEYVITNDADRMGYRLDGPKIEHVRGADIISDGIAAGAIQVPAHGRPIIMLADRQTTGGYPKIAHIITADLSIVAQKKPGDRLHFTAVPVAEAQRLYRLQQAQLRQLQLHLTIKSPVVPATSHTCFMGLVQGRWYTISVQEVTDR